MNIDQLSSILCRVFFVGAFGLLALALLERLVFTFGYTIMRGALTGGRLLEIAGIALVFVIALLLRQIRDDQRSSSAG